MKVSKIMLSALFAVSLLMLAACGNKEERAAKITDSPAVEKQSEASSDESTQAFVYKDINGEHKLAQKPAKIATAVTYLTDHMIALGLTPTATVKSQNEDFPLYLKPHLNNVEIIGEQGKVSLEKLLTAAPDLIITDTNSKKVYDQFAQIAPMAYLNNGYNAPTWQDAFRATADAFGMKDKAEQIILSNQDQKKKTIEKVADKIKGKTLMMLRIRKDLRYYGDVDYKWMYDEIGFSRPTVYPTTSIDAHYEVLSMEMLPDIDPDYILLINDDEKTAHALEGSNVWKNMKAVKNGHVYQIASDSWFGGYGPLAANSMLDDISRLFGS